MTSPAALYAPPRSQKTAPPAQTWWDHFQGHRDLYMAPQVYSWTCSICAATWVLQATGLDPNASREAVGAHIGYPNCVNEAYGLMSSDCLVALFADYGIQAHTEWVDWNRALQLCRETTGCLNSTRWYHFVGVRGLYGSNTLWVANSAPGYQGIWDQISYGQFQAWAGSWKFIWLEH